MKRTIGLILVLVMLLSMTACGKTPAFKDLMNYPAAPTDLKACESFLKSCGYEIEYVNEKGITFTDGYWTGYGFTNAVSLTYLYHGKDDADFEKEVSAARAMIQELCGQPYSSRESQQTYFRMLHEFYSYEGKVVTLTVNYSTSNMIDIAIYPNANK